jgi:hypothetical protein
VDKISDAIVSANQRLKAGNVGIGIFRRGSKLSLRGVLPPKPGKNKKSQQTIALDIFANPAGIKRAEKEAHKLSGLLATREFDWNDYLNVVSGSSLEIGETVAKFKSDYFNRRALTAESETTWANDYQNVFNKFPRSGELTSEILLQTVLRAKPDSRSRRRACLATKAIASFASIDFDPLPYVGKYSPKAVQPRDLPSDKEINDFYYQISNPAWQFAFGLQAAYGLRNYEIFTSDLTSLRQSPGHLLVKDGINGDRVVWCLYPEWWKDWELGRDDRVLPSVHVETYQKWITEEHNNRLYQLLIERLDRPYFR